MSESNDGEQRRECVQLFQQFRRELDSYKKDHDLLVELKTQLEHLSLSMSTLTRAIWGMLGSTIMLLAGFMVWFIQSLFNR